MSSHMPKNHPLRPLYRFLALLAGGYCLVFGIVGSISTAGRPAFDRDPVTVLGLRTNLAFAVLSIVVGGLVVAVLAIGRNVDRSALMVLGPGFMLVGLVMLAVLRTGANVLNFSLATVNVSFLIGLVLFAAAMYIEVAPHAEAAAEEARRRSTAPRSVSEE